MCFYSHPEHMMSCMERNGSVPVLNGFLPTAALCILVKILIWTLKLALRVGNHTILMLELPSFGVPYCPFKLMYVV